MENENETPVTSDEATSNNEASVTEATSNNELLDRLARVEAMVEQSVNGPKKEAQEYKEKYQQVSKEFEEYKRRDQQKEAIRQKEQENAAKREQVWNARGRPADGQTDIVKLIVDAAYDAIVSGSKGGTVPFTKEGTEKVREYLQKKAEEDYEKYIRGKY